MAGDEVTDADLGTVTVGFGKIMDGTLDSTNKLIVNSSGEALVKPTANSQVDVNKLAGTTTDTNSGNKSAGTLRVVLATDQPALTNKLLVTPDLPTGAATAAKQPAIGTAGTASADVITVQGKAAMTPLLVDGSAATQPVSGSVTATQGTATNLKTQAEAYQGGSAVASGNPLEVNVRSSTLSLATSTKQSDGTQKTQVVDGSGNVATTHTAGSSKGLDVSIIDGSGNQVTSFGGGTQYTEDAASAADPIGTALNLVRNDSRTGSITTTDGDNIAARGTNSGELYVKHVDAIPVTDNSGSLTVDQGTATNLKTQAEAYQGGTAVSSSNPLNVNTGLPTPTKFVSASSTLTANTNYVPTLTVSGFTARELEITSTGSALCYYTLDNTTPSSTNFSGILPATPSQVILDCNATPTLKVQSAGTPTIYVTVRGA
jgi:hypothetical protein